MDALWAIPAYWRDGGILLIPIALVSFGIWASWLRLRAGLRVSVQRAREKERELEVNLSNGTSALNGDAAARRRFEAEIRTGNERLNREVFLLKALTAAAPLLGLLGTVTGMVDTFTAVSRHGADSAVLVAEGIRTALLTTQFGLVAALPGVFGLLQIGRLRAQWQQAAHAVGILTWRGGATEGGAYA